MEFGLFVAGLVIGVVTGILQNWIKPWGWVRQWMVWLALGVTVLGAAGLSYWTVYRKASLELEITQPAPTAAIGPIVPLTATIERDLPEGHQLWAEQHNTQEAGRHYAEAPCDVMHNRSVQCPDLFIGGKDDAGKSFVITIVSCDADAVRQLEGPGYRQRDKSADGAYAGQPPVRGCASEDSVIVQRR